MAGAGLKPTPEAQARRLGHQWIETIVKPRFLDECHSERSEESSHFSSIDPSLTLRVSEKAILKTYRQSRMSLEFFQDNVKIACLDTRRRVSHIISWTFRNRHSP
jgi:hypothetical protein